MRTSTWTATLVSSRPARNVAWNALGGLWVGLLTVLATPWYVSRLGLDGYGVVGLWLMMQTMMGLLDLGMGASLVKDFANTTDEGASAARGDLLKSLELVYWPIAAGLMMVVAFAAPWLGEHWLHSSSLSAECLASVIRTMSLALGIQFPCSLYSNGLAGLQDQGRMNRLQILGNGLRFGGGAAILVWRADLVWFFLVQAVVAGIQTLATRRALWRQIRPVGSGPALFRPDLLRRLWRFSTGMALIAFAGVLLANLDRIFLSRIASTAEIGKYALAFTAAGLLQMGIQPFYRAHFPRYAELVSSGDTIRLRLEYFHSCKVMAAVLVPLGVAASVFAPWLFQAWIGTQDPTVIRVFRWLLVGIAGSGLMWLPAALQQAHGWTRLHATMIVGALLLGAAAMFWTIPTFGTAGATVAWVLHGVSEITLELWLMHRRLLTGGLAAWYRSVLLPPLISSFAIAGVAWWLMPTGLGRWSGFAWVVGAGVVLMSVSLFATLAPERSLRGVFVAREP